MLKLNKILIKKGFKSIFVSKVFSFLIMFLIIISGATYTMLESSSNSFNQSYNSVTNEGKLHDAIIKENFKFSTKKIQNSTLNIAPFYYSKLEPKKKQEYTLTTQNLDERALSTTLENNKQYYQINLKAQNTTTGIYSHLKNKTLKSIKVYKNNSTSVNVIKQIQEQIENIKSRIILNLEKNLSTTYMEALKKDYGKELFVKETKSIFVSKNNKFFKIVQYNKSHNVNKMIIYDGTSNFFEPLTKKQLENELKRKLALKGKTLIDINENYYFNIDKGYKYFLHSKTGLSGTSLGDPSSFEAIVSPAYANKNNKHTISTQELKKLFDENSSFMDDLKQDPTSAKYQKYKNQLIFIDKSPFFIIGIGTTPDFAYPIITKSLPLVDPKNQAIIFTTKKGFQRIADSFRSNFQENYISIKFKDNINKKRQNIILQEIENKTRNGTYPKSYFPQNIKIVTRADDANEQILLAPNRTIILDKLKNTISTLSYTTTTLLIVFLLSIITMIFKVLVSSNNRVLATMWALGYSKWQIAISNGIAAIALSVIPTIISYVIGYGLQFIFIENFDILWTIPTYSYSFSFISIVAIVVVPLIAIFLIIVLTTIYEMKFKISNILNNDTQKDPSKVSQIISKVKFMGIKIKYVFSLSFKNIDKLVLITISAFISMLSLMIGFGTIFKAQNAYNETVNINNYEFAINLVTPTSEGGQYSELKRQNIPYVGKTTSSGVRWHQPKIQDIKWTDPSNAIKDPHNASIYLKNQLQLAAILKTNTNLPTNPWNIAKRLMPENQLKTAENNYKKIKEEQKKTGQTLNNLIYRQITDHSKNIPYIISYNQVITDNSDEKFTYIDAMYQNKQTNFQIKGINLNTKMINIKSKLQQASQSASQLPILINKYISEKWSLNKGDYLDLIIQNHAYRNHKNQQPTKVKAQIVAIVDGYNEIGMYTLRTKANKVLQLDEVNGFNGIFTLNTKPTILKTLPLYSTSNLYPAIDSFVGKWEKFLKIYLDSPQWIKKNTKSTNVVEFYQTYSRTPLVSSVKGVRWNSIDKTTFKNISKLTSTIILLVEITSIILSIIFTTIVATLIFKSNKKKIAALLLLGYRKKEVTKMFLSMYIVPLLIAFLIATPIMFGVLSALRSFIINFGNILIPFAVTWWMPLASLFLTTTIFVISTFITIFAQRKNYIIEMFKGD